MIELVLAIGLLSYAIINLMELTLSEKTFNKIIYHSKATQITAQIISIIGVLTIAFGTMVFVAVVVLSVIKSGFFQKTLIELDFKPVMLFLTVIGSLTIIWFPLFFANKLPGFGGKRK